MVGIGEIDDGAFPSLAHASANVVFEEYAAKASRMSLTEAWAQLAEWPELVRSAQKIIGANSEMKAELRVP